MSIDDDERPEMITGDDGQSRPVIDPDRAEAEAYAQKLKETYYKQNPHLRPAEPDDREEQVYSPPVPEQEQAAQNAPENSETLPNGNAESEQGVHIKSVTLTVEQPAASAEQPPWMAAGSSDINEGGLPGLPRQPRKEGISSELQAAYNYHAQGLPPIPIKRGAKQAAIDGWQSRSIPVEEFGQYWGGSAPCGLAIPLGARSKGLIDMDLDWPEARALADELPFLYGGLLAFGRKGSPRAHRLAFCKEALDLDNFRTIAFTIPGALAKTMGLSNEEHASNVLELRGNNGYTIFPPSTHTSGERIEWDSAGGSVQEMPYEELRFKAGVLANAALMVRFYPPVGMRNDFNLALGGMFLRAMRGKYDEDEDLLIEHVDRLVTTICRLGGDTGRGPSWEKRAATTLNKMKGNAQVTGLPKICEILGFPELEKVLRKWLGVNADDRPTITYDETDMTTLLDNCQDAMIASGVELYRRAGGLAHLYRLEEVETMDEIRREKGAIVIGGVGKDRITAYLTDVARFQVFKPTPKPHFVPITPTERLCKIFLSYVDGWKFKPLLAVAETPTMRADGSVIDSEGYDTASALYLDFSGVTFPHIPDSPTKADALLALQDLKHLIRGFPFVPDDPQQPDRSPSRSAVLATMLHSIIRRILPSAPMLLIGAPTAGTGKTLLANLIAIIATGRKAAAASLGKTEEEFEKRISSTLRRGDPVILYDNITVPLDSELLCSALTEKNIHVRILGGNEVVDLPTNTTWIVTGNRIQVKGDLARRCIKCEMDAEVEAPELRKFDFDAAIEAMEDRPKLVAAVLTILRAWHICAERADLLSTFEPLGSFQHWSDMVRGALIWLGEPDPCGMRESIANEEPTSVSLTQLLVAWSECEALEPGTPYTAAQVLAIANNAGAYAEFHNAWTNCIKSFNGTFPLAAMSQYLSKNSGRILSGRRIVKTVDKHTKTPRYALDIVSQHRAEKTTPAAKTTGSEVAPSML